MSKIRGKCGCQKMCSQVHVGRCVAGSVGTVKRTTVCRARLCAGGCQRADHSSRSIILCRSSAGRHRPLGDLPRNADAISRSGGGAVQVREAVEHATGVNGIPVVDFFALIDRASLFLLRTTKDFVPVLDMEVLGDEFRLREGARVRGGHSYGTRVDRSAVQGRLFSSSLRTLLGRPFKSYCSKSQSRWNIQRAIWQPTLG